MAEYAAKKDQGMVRHDKREIDGMGMEHGSYGLTGHRLTTRVNRLGGVVPMLGASLVTRVGTPNWVFVC